MAKIKRNLAQVNERRSSNARLCRKRKVSTIFQQAVKHHHQSFAVASRKRFLSVREQTAWCTDLWILWVLSRMRGIRERVSSEWLINGVPCSSRHTNETYEQRGSKVSRVIPGINFSIRSCYSFCVAWKDSGKLGKTMLKYSWYSKTRTESRVIFGIST